MVFERDGDRLVNQGYCRCGFVPMQGVSAHTERLIPLDGDEVGLRVDEQQPVDTDRLREALFAPRIERWSGVVFDRPDELELWLTTALSVLGLLTAKDGPIGRGLLAPSAVRGVPAIVRDGSFAYRTKRPIEGTNEFELGVSAHGLEAEAVAAEYVETAPSMGPGPPRWPTSPH